MRSNLASGCRLMSWAARRDECKAELEYRIEPGSLIFTTCGALVGGAAGGACQYPTPALQDSSVSTIVKLSCQRKSLPACVYS
jgi:hypothetical protein